MNTFSSKKLLHSKWTKIESINIEKHFIVTEIKFDEKGEVIECIIEAVISKKSKNIDWIELKNDRIWTQGWK